MISVLGSGVAGLCAATALAEAGFAVELIAPEAAPEVPVEPAAEAPADVAPETDAPEAEAAAPSVATGVSVVTWTVWGLGSAVLLAVGAGIHLCVSLWARRSTGAARRSAY